MEGGEHRFARVNGILLHYVKVGQGPPLLHGWPGFWYEWRRNIPALAQHFTLLVPDLRGVASSEKPEVPPEAGYTPEVGAEDMLALARQEGFTRFSLVAHDLGAIVAQVLARQHPGAVERLVGSSREALEVYLRHFLSHWSVRKGLFTEEEVAYVEAYSQPGALRGCFNGYRALLRTRGWRERVPITHPTLVLWSAGDPILPLEWRDRLNAFFWRLTFRRVPECGHFVPLEVLLFLLEERV